MGKISVQKYWLAWLISSVAIAAFFAYLLIGEGVSKTLFMPGPLSPGHHQLAESCDSCHTDSFGGGEVLQESCIACHGDVRVKPFDSHPAAKFKDPRNADRLEKIDATQCVTCHVEHKPEITLVDGLTQPRDVCFHCHADVGEERPSHEGMGFNTCKDSGCHNYHNNRALYTDFLTKHMDDPHHLPKQKVRSKEFAEVVEEIMEYPHDRYPLQVLSIDDMDSPDQLQIDPTLQRDWLETAHAQAGVNCTGCHQLPATENQDAQWVDKPGMDSCASCHNIEVDRFQQGKHGMRIAAGLSPMTPKDALLPMNENAAHESLTCNSCHGAHRFDTQFAAVDGCLQCHADEHSLAYKGTPHHALWERELSDASFEDQGVSCATCHMARIELDVNDWMARTVVDHNQSANLSPNSKMIRSSCLHCHGLGFAIDALADRELIDKNFAGMPSVKVDSIELARKDLERYLREREQATQ